MTTFALVHGAWAGAWCWERVAPELEARGHRVVAIDLPCEDPTATFETYADVVVRALDSVGGEEPVVVGHSLGGLTIPLVAARRRVRRLVYLCAFVPIPGCSFAEQLGMEPDTLLPEYSVGVSEPDEAGRARWVDEGIARSVLFADATAEKGGLRAAASTGSDAVRRAVPAKGVALGSHYVHRLQRGPHREPGPEQKSRARTT